MELPLLLILWCTPLIQSVPITPIIVGSIEIELKVPPTPLDEPKTAIKTSEEEILDIITKYAEIYQVAADLAIDLAKYESNLDPESNLNPEAKNKNSSARGLYQFLAKSTWGKFCEGDIYSPENNARCAMKIIGGSQTGIRHWTASLPTREMLLYNDYAYCTDFSRNICFLK